MATPRNRFEEYPEALRLGLEAVLHTGYIRLIFTSFEDAERHRKYFLGMRESFINDPLKPEHERRKMESVCTAIKDNELWVFESGAKRKYWRDRWKQVEKYRNESRANRR